MNRGVWLVALIGSFFIDNPAQAKKLTCPPGYWESQSLLADNFCVRKDVNNYDGTPIDLITRVFDEIPYKSVRCALEKDQTTIGEQLRLREMALGTKLHHSDSTLAQIWPATRGKLASTMALTQMLCEGTRCQALEIGANWAANLLSTITWNLEKLVISGWTNALEYSLFNYQKINLGALPSRWFYEQRLASLINAADLWQTPISEGGLLTPTAGQLNQRFYQLVATGTGANLHGRINATYKFTNPKDQTRPHERQGGEPILTGSNRYVKTKCNAQGEGAHHNACGYLQVTLGSGGEQTYLLVNGEFDKTLGGDRILANTRADTRSFTGTKEELGNFTGLEPVGTTNDIPILRQGSNVDWGQMVDACNLGFQFFLLPYKFRGNSLFVPSYHVENIQCDPQFRFNKKAERYVILYGQQGPNYITLNRLNRECSLRQIYRIQPCPNISSFEIGAAIRSCKSNAPSPTLCCGFDHIQVTACKFTQLAGKSNGEPVRELEQHKPFPWMLRGGLKEDQR